MKRQEYKIITETIIHNDKALETLGIKKPLKIPLIYYVVSFEANGCVYEAHKWINPAAINDYWTIIEAIKDNLILMKKIGITK